MGRFFFFTIIVCVITINQRVPAQANAQAEVDFPSKSESTLRLAAGRNGGSYYAIAHDLAALEGVNISIIESQGAVDNINLLRSGETDIAIVQNDLAHYLYRGQNGFSRYTEFKSLFPLFDEYVQVVTLEKDNISLLSELRGKRINVGLTDSGTYYNALHVLEEAKLTEGVDFLSSYYSNSESLEKLRAGTLDAIFMTGRLVDDGPDSGLKVIEVPPRIVRTLSDQFPYYRLSRIEKDDGTEHLYLTVRSYLVAAEGESISQHEVTKLARSIIRGWESLQEDWPSLGALENTLVSHPVPYSPIIPRELARGGHINASWPFQMIVGVSILIWLLIFAICVSAMRRRTSYNRLGEIASNKELAIQQRAIDFVARISPYVVGVSAAILMLVISFLIVQLTEANYAQANNIDNEFVGMSVWDGFLWLFSFVVSGLTLQDTLPQSTPGLIVSNLMALIGVMGPVTLILIVLANMNKQREKRIQGDLCSPHKNHVLICGWNEKASGIVYSLTGEDVDEKRRVTIVAERRKETPIDLGDFDERFVHFCRGDSSSREVLAKANAKYAKTAIVLCDAHHREAENLSGVLTTMNLRSLSDDMHICAELAYDKNFSHFLACGCNTIISPDKLVARIAALSTVSPYLVDFIFDIVTYNQQDQLMAETVHGVEMITGEKLVGAQAYEVHQKLIRRGGNLIGLIEQGCSRSGLFDSAFAFALASNGGQQCVEENSGNEPSKAERFLPLTTAEGRTINLRADHTLIFSAKSRESISTLRKDHIFDKVKPISAKDLTLHHAKPTGVLLFSDDEQQAIVDALKGVHGEIRIDVFPSPTALLTTEELDQYLSDGTIYSHVILLASKEQRIASVSEQDFSEIDATTILNTRFLRTYLNERQNDCNLKITVEALSAQNRAMFKEATADCIISSFTLVERFLIKEVYERSKILEYIIALLNVDDGVHLYSFEIQEGDTLCGKQYAQILMSRIEGFRLVGWLPKSQRELLRNRTGDFDFHFRTVVGRRIVQARVQAGDQLIAVLDRRKVDRLIDNNTLPGIAAE